jgi:hypothetical protein
MNPIKFGQLMKHLVRAKQKKPDLPEVFRASEAQIPEKTLTRDMFREAQERFKNAKAGGGMLVQPGFGGTRQGYADDDGRRVKNKKRLKQLDEETALYTDGRYKTYDSLPDDRKLKQTIGKRATLRAQGKNIGAGKGQPGVLRPVGEDFVSPMKDARVAAKKVETSKLKYQSSPVGERLQWIANNGKNYDNPETFIKAYEKHFKHKIGSKKDVLFNTPGKKALTQIDNLINTGRTQQDLFTLTFKDGKAFNQEELFKASIIQNNPEIKKEFKTLFNNIYKDVSVYSELGPEGIVERLNKGKLLKDFDFVKFGVGSGITRNSLLNAANVKPEHVNSFQNVRKPIMSISRIIENLKNPSFAKGFKISPTTATKIRGQLDNFLEGEKNLIADIKKINNQLGDVKFNQIFGGVNFEHTLAKQFGKDYKYLPRNYLLKGQFTTKAFNLFKRDAFDLPLIKLMKQYEQGKVSGAQVQKFIDDFNAKTNNYADFNFDINKGRLAYSDNAVKYDLSRYADPNVARQELIKNIDLTMSPEFQKGFKNLPEARDQLKLFRSKDAKNIRNLVATLGGGNCGRLGGYQGGRVGLQDGTPSVVDCYNRATNRINSGFKNATPAEARNYTKLLNTIKSSAVIGKNLLKFGIVPEALYVGADSLVRVGFGDTFKEAGLRAADFFIPDDQTRDADVLKAQRTLGNAAATNVGKVLDYRNQIAKIDSLESQKQNLENLSDVGEFDYIGDLNQDVKNIDTRLNQAKNDLQNKFMVSEAETIAGEKALEESYDISKAKSPLAKLQLFARNIEGVQDDPFLSDVTSPEKTQMDLNLNMLPRLRTNIMQFKTSDAIDLAQALRAQGRDVSAKDVLTYRDQLKEMPLMDAANQFGREQVFGTQGTFFGQPLAGGGIAKLAGVDSGPPPSSGPNSQGLQGLMKRVKKL